MGILLDTNWVISKISLNNFNFVYQIRGVHQFNFNYLSLYIPDINLFLCLNVYLMSFNGFIICFISTFIYNLYFIFFI